MLPYSNNSNSEGLEILSLACWRFPEGDWEFVKQTTHLEDVMLMVQ